MTAEGNCDDCVVAATLPLMDKRRNKRKRGLSSNESQCDNNDNKVKLVCTATVPVKRFKVPYSANDMADGAIKRRRSLTTGSSTGTPARHPPRRERWDASKNCEMEEEKRKLDTTSFSREERNMLIHDYSHQRPPSHTSYVKLCNDSSEELYPQEIICDSQGIYSLDASGENSNTHKSASKVECHIASSKIDCTGSTDVQTIAMSPKTPKPTCATKTHRQEVAPAASSHSVSNNTTTSSKVETHAGACEHICDVDNRRGSEVISVAHNSNESGPTPTATAQRTSLSMHDSFVSEHKQKSGEGKEHASTNRIYKVLNFQPSLSSTDDEGRNPAAEDAVVFKSITTSELVKFLNQNNLTLKAVPVEEAPTSGTKASGIKLTAVSQNGKAGIKLLPPSTDPNGKTRIRAAIPISSKELRAFALSPDQDMTEPVNAESSVVLQLRLLQSNLSREASSVKSQSAFCSWRIGGVKTRKTCKLQHKTAKQSDGKSAPTIDRKLRVASLENPGCSTPRAHFSHDAAPLNGTCDGSMSKDNTSVVLHTSCLQGPAIPLSCAFNDIEARDRAARETMQSLEESYEKRTGLALKLSGGADLCPLSPTMAKLVNAGKVKRGKDRDIDPVLTSAVALEGECTPSFLAVADRHASLKDPSLRPVSSDADEAADYVFGVCQGVPDKCEKDLSGLIVSSKNDTLGVEEGSARGHPLPGYCAVSKKCSINESDRIKNCKSQPSVDYDDSRRSSLTSEGSIELPPLECDRESEAHLEPQATNGSYHTDSNPCARGVELREMESSITKGRLDNVKTVSSSRKRGLEVLSCDCSDQSKVTLIDARSAKSISITEKPHTAGRRTDDSTGLKNTDNARAKPLESWSSSDVTVWLKEVTAQFQRHRKLEITENKSSAIIYFDSITGRDLYGFTLDDFVARCGSVELAEHLFAKVEVVKSNCEKNKMYNGVCCASASPICVPVTSAELEESLNFDDLLGSDSILGSLELSEAQSNSYLKSLAEESDMRSLTCHGELRNTGTDMRSPSNHYCHDERFSSIAEGLMLSTQTIDRPSPYLQSPPPTYPPPLLHASTYIYQKGLNFVEAHAVKTPFHHGHSARSVKIESPEQNTPHFSQFQGANSYEAISPSIFYNISTPTGTAEQKFQFQYGTSEPTLTPEKSNHISLLSAPCAREATMSDTDSGIHSPESTPNKFLGPKFNPLLLGTSSGSMTSPVHAKRVTSAAIMPCNGVWAEAERKAETPYGLSNSPLATEVFTFSGAGISDGDHIKKGLDRMDDFWERGSTSSTASTISAESETKLLNMDDCKTYIAEPSCVSFQHNVPDNAQHSSQALQTPTGNVVFVSTLATTKSPQHDSQPGVGVGQQSLNYPNKRQATVTQGNITTVYPAFMSNVRRTHSLSSNEGREPNKQLFDAASAERLITRSASVRTCGDKRPIGLCLHPTGESATQYLERMNGNEGQESSPMEESFDAKMRRTTGKSVHLWEFIRDTLLNPLYCPRLIKWEDRAAGVFRFVQSDVVAGMWGEKKNNPKMTYEKLSRAMRYYYNRGILERVDGRRLVYKFGKNAHGWQQSPTADGAPPSAENVTPCRGTRQPTEKKNGDSPKRSASCKISVTISNSVLPSPNKRRRQSMNDFSSGSSPPSADLKSAGTQTPPAVSSKMARVSDDLDTDPKSSPEEVTECVVFVAGSEEVEKVAIEAKVELDEGLEKIDSKVDTWQEHSPDSCGASSPDRQPKLPSANVLLGKHYKIATAAM